MKTIGRHADDRQFAAVDAYGTADGIWYAAQPRLPESVRDDDDGLGARPGRFVGADEAAPLGLEAEPAEVVARDEQCKGAFGAALVADVQRYGTIGNQLTKGVHALAEVAELGPRHARIRAGFSARLDEMKRRGVAHARDRVKDQGLDPREYRRIHADPHAERKDHDGGETRPAANQSPGVAHAGNDLGGHFTLFVK